MSFMIIQPNSIVASRTTSTIIAVCDSAMAFSNLAINCFISLQPLIGAGCVSS